MDGRRSPPDGATTESGVQADSSAAIKCAGAVRVGRNARSKNKTGSWADADLAGTVVHFDRDVALSGLSPLWCRSGIFPALVILHKVPFSVSNYRPVTLYERFVASRRSRPTLPLRITNTVTFPGARLLRRRPSSIYRLYGVHPQPLAVRLNTGVHRLLCWFEG